MDYSKHYRLLIERARVRECDGYSEVHHILPRCMNGGNESENLFRLFPEEHCIAHLLLVKIYPDQPKLVYALI